MDTLRSWTYLSCKHINIWISYEAERSDGVLNMLRWRRSGGNSLSDPFVTTVLGFCLYASRILLIWPLWEEDKLFIPVLSPLYMQASHWKSSHTRTLALLLHVVTGCLALLCALLQFSSSIRKHRSIHRWTGRLFLLSGYTCIGCLFLLRPVMGRGSRTSPSLSVQLFSDVCAIHWTATTMRSVVAVVLQRDFFQHQLWMTRAFCVLLTPMVQRAINYIPSVAVFLIVMLCIFVSDCGWIFSRYVSGHPWMDSLVYLSHNPSRWYPPLGNGEIMLSLRGFGVVEQLVFGLSAWLALICMLVVGEIVVRSQVLDRNKHIDESLGSLLDPIEGEENELK